MCKSNHQVHLEFGLQSKEFYDESFAPRSSPAQPHRRGPSRIDEATLQVKPALPEILRTFKFMAQPALDQGLFQCIGRHNELWTEFTAMHGTTGVKRDEFLKFKNEKDPFCAALTKRLAPVLYFNFKWTDSAEHILETITIETLRFKQYKGGGGFIDRRAWYDILLSHEPGLRNYAPEPSLVCGSTGRVELRLWSDNFHPHMGWLSPLGEYILRLKFEFFVAGEKPFCITEPFAIDV